MSAVDSVGCIDIMVPYAGRGDFLRAAVGSVLGQSDPNWTLTVVEDGDHDRSIAGWLASLDEARLRYRKNVEQLGVAANFELCLRASTQEFVVFLGCDDLLGTEYVASVRRALAFTADIDVVQPHVQVIDADGNVHRPAGDRVKGLISPRRRPQVLHGDALLASLMIGNWTYFPSLCWRRTAITGHGFRQDLGTVLDLELLARVILDGGRLLVTPDHVFSYRRHGASVSSRTAIRADRFVEERTVMREVSVRAEELGWKAAARAARQRPTSRLHALTLLPRAVRLKDTRAAGAMLRHLLT